MIRFLLFTFLIFIISSAVAQVDPVGNFNRHIMSTWAGDYIRISQYQVKGSPYLLGESFPGSIYYQDGKMISDKKIFFNLYDGKVGLDMNNQFFEADVPVTKFSLQLPEKYGRSTLEFVHTTLLGQTDIKEYANLLCDGGRVAFLKLFKIRLAPDPTNLLAKEKKVFEQYYEYLLFDKQTKEIKKIKLKEKDIMKELHNDAEAKKFATDNKINFSRESEVIMLLNHYNFIKTNDNSGK